MDTFCLILLVNDKEDTITECLDSVISIIDEYVICDTGCTDDTVSVIVEYMKKHNKSGHFCNHPQLGAKNFVFKEAHELSSAQYFIYLEDTDTITPINKTLLSDECDVYSVPVLTKGDEDYRSPEVCIVRNNKLYHWEYPIHEVIKPSSETVVLSDCLITRIANPINPDDAIKLLTPYANDAHTHFYLAHYLEQDSKYGAAVQHYIACGDNTEYSYVANLRVGRIYRYKLFSYQIAADHFLKAISICPDRLEATYEYLCLLELTREFQNGAKHISFDKINITIPTGFMVEPAVYDWKYAMEASFIAHKAGDNVIAVKIGSWLLASNRYPTAKAEAIKSNLFYFNQALMQPVQPLIPSINPPTPILEKGPTELFGNFPIRVQRPQSIVVDNFFENPDMVRAFALSQDYGVKGNYPGSRTQSFASDSHKTIFERIIGRKITHWPGGYNGSFQYTTADMKSWIHRDMTDYSAMVYLSPNAPLDAGTLVFRHKESGLTYGNGPVNELLNKDSGDHSKWDVVEEVKNVYNRLIIFDGRRSHMSNKYFGTNLQDGRLFMVFFFDVEK